MQQIKTLLPIHSLKCQTLNVLFVPKPILPNRKPVVYIANIKPVENASANSV